MPDPVPTPPSADQSFDQNVGAQENRKLKSRQMGPHVWSGLGLLGLFGWSVCLPTLLGAWLGHWLDQRHPGTHGWTLALLVAGLCIGCINAGHWISKEQQVIRRGQEDEG